jgi:hypothetical protein
MLRKSLCPRGNDMSNKAELPETDSNALSDKDDAQDHEATAVMDDNRAPMQDDDATVVLGDTYRANVANENDG